ncbi:hypothetical protein CSR02_12350, partial [Acetobacter pomorum]
QPSRTYLYPTKNAAPRGGFFAAKFPSQETYRIQIGAKLQRRLGELYYIGASTLRLLEKQTALACYFKIILAELKQPYAERTA